jgi:hypothetical protein
LHFCLDYKDFYCNDVDDNNPTKVTITTATIKTTKTKATLFLQRGKFGFKHFKCNNVDEPNPYDLVLYVQQQQQPKQYHQQQSEQKQQKQQKFCSCGKFNSKHF